MRSDFGEMRDHRCKAFGMPHGASYADGAASVLTGHQNVGRSFRHDLPGSV